jgi:hypothetical protein
VTELKLVTVRWTETVDYEATVGVPVGFPTRQALEDDDAAELLTNAITTQVDMNAAVTAVTEREITEVEDAEDDEKLPTCPECGNGHDPRPCARVGAACDCCRAMFDKGGAESGLLWAEGHEARAAACDALDAAGVPPTVWCDECGQYVPDADSMVSGTHSETCSLHSDNVN